MSADCVIFSSTGTTKFPITDTKRYVPVVTISTHDNAKLLQQLKFGFKIAINWNKYESKTSIETRNPYLDFFQGVNRLFILLCEGNDDKESHRECFLPKLEINDYNFMIDGQNPFDQQAKLT